MGDYGHISGDRALDIFGPLTPKVRKETTPKPPPPEEGFLLVEKVGQRFIRVTKPDGSFKSGVWIPDHNLDLLLRSMGVPDSKKDRLLDYVWSYRYAYVSTSDTPEPYPLDDRIDNAGVKFTGF